MSRISVRSVTKSFDDHMVLNGINLEINAGECISLIGPSGSGKSTLLRCMNLLETVDDGEILLDGTDVSAPGYDANLVRRRVGMVFQSFNLFPHMSVIENITLAPVRAHGVERTAARESGLALLQRFGLADKAGAYPDQLSGGQQQRVAIVRALAVQPEVLLLDEITSALDPELVGEVLDVVRDLKASGMTLVLATHEMAFARETSDVVCVLDEGVIIEQGDPREVFTAPRSERARRFLQRIVDSGRL